MRVMFSAPPAITTSASPLWISREAVLIASRPEPQMRFTFIAGVPTGSPAFTVEWRER